jgi:RNA polymerase sigma factor (sigma-70 family)
MGRWPRSWKRSHPMIKTTTDVAELHTLILRIAQGDEASFEALYDQMNTQVSGYLASNFRRQLAPKDVEDIMQYTFLQIWRKANTYRGKHTNSSAKKWVYTIARNRAYKVVKALKSVPISIEAYYRSNDNEDKSAHEYEFPSTDHTENEALEILMSNKVVELCRELTKREKDILIMRFEKNRTLREIGKDYSLSSPRIKQIIDGILEFLFYALQ